jgi:hypothetical protein
MGYYVDLDSAEVADQLWANYGNTPTAGTTLGNTRPEGANKLDGAPAEESTEALCNVDVTETLS